MIGKTWQRSRQSKPAESGKPKSQFASLRKGKQALVQTVGSARAQSQRAQEELEKEHSTSEELRLRVNCLEGDLASAQQQLKSFTLESSSKAVATAKQRMHDLESQVAKSEAQTRAAQRESDRYRLQALEARQTAEEASVALEGLKAAMEEACTSKDLQIANLEQRVVAEVAVARRAEEKLLALHEEVADMHRQLDAAVARLETHKVKWDQDKDQYQQKLSDERKQSRQTESELQQTRLKLLDTEQELETLKQQGPSSESKVDAPTQTTAKKTEVQGSEKGEARDEAKQEPSKEPTRVTEEKQEPSKEPTQGTSTPKARPSPDDFMQRADEKARLRTELAELRQMLTEAGFTDKDAKERMCKRFI